MRMRGSTSVRSKRWRRISWIIVYVVVTTSFLPVHVFSGEPLLSKPLHSFSQSDGGLDTVTSGAVDIVVDMESDPNAVNLNAKMALDFGIVKGYLQLEGNGTDTMTAGFQITHNYLPPIAKNSMSFFLELQSRKNGIFDFRREAYKYQWTYTEKKITASTKISETRIWRAYVFVRSPYTIPYAWHLYTPGWVYNKKAQKYPFIKSPITKRRLPQANTNWKKVENPVPWTKSIRTAYRRRYEERHPEILKHPGIYWDEIDIHHIRPRKYGGTNKNSNLIPVYQNPSHRALNKWFVNY